MSAPGTGLGHGCTALCRPARHAFYCGTGTGEGWHLHGRESSAEEVADQAPCGATLHVDGRTYMGRTYACDLSTGHGGPHNDFVRLYQWPATASSHAPRPDGDGAA